MDKKFSKSLMAAAVVSALASPLAANAAINFDLDGVMGGVVQTVTQFDWGNQSVLAQGFFSGDVPLAAGTTVTGFLFGHGSLSSTHNGATSQPVPDGSPLSPVFTYQFSIQVLGTFGATGTFTYSNLSPVNNGATNFFHMFYDPTSGVNLTSGVGFGTANGEVNADQTLILSGKLRLSTPSTFTHEQGATDGVTPDAPLNNTTPPTGPDPSAEWSIDGSGNLRMNIDVCRTVEGGTVAHPTCPAAFTDVVDTNFFPNSVVNGLIIDLNLFGGIASPYVQFVPPATVLTLAPIFGTAIGGILDSDGAAVPGTHEVNNFTCDDAGFATQCDMLYQGTSGISSVNGTTVPEPGVLALLGLGLAGVGFSARRNRSRKV